MDSSALCCGVTVMDDLERIKVGGKERVVVTVGSGLDIFGCNKEMVVWHFKQAQYPSMGRRPAVDIVVKLTMLLINQMENMEHDTKINMFIIYSNIVPLI